MLSIIIKTVIIFLLVVIVLHLIIKKTINERDSSPIVIPNEHIESPKTNNNSNETYENKDAEQDGGKLEKEKEQESVVVHSTTNIVHASTEDDLFNFVYKDKQVEKSSEKQKNKKVDIIDNNCNIQGICSYDDEYNSYYQELK